MKVRRFQDPEALTAELAAALASVMRPAPGGPRAVMLAGGRTPQAAYRALAARPPPADERLHVFLSDERCVPPDSPESNQGRLTGLFRALDLPERRILRVRAERPPDEAAAQYHLDLQALLDAGATIPLGLLGLGADGHTASLFSPEDVRREPARLAVAVRRPSPPDRVSVTPALLARVEKLLFIAAGADKAAISERLVRDPASLPAGLAVAGARDVELWIA